MSHPTISDIKLAIVPAMLGNIDGALRALSFTVDAGSEEIVLHAVYPCPPDENQADRINCIASELDAYLGSFNIVTEIVVRPLQVVLDLPGHLVYRRYESSCK